MSSRPGVFISLVCFFFAFQASAQVNFVATEMVGRITDSSATLHAEVDANIQYYYEYGIVSGSLSGTSDTLSATAYQPFETIIAGIIPDTRYYYRLNYSSDGGTTWNQRAEHNFHTQRAPGSAFIFTITSDSHMKSWTDSAILNLYNITLNNVQADQPDFHFDHGDTFGVDTVDTGQVAVMNDEYLFQRNLFGQFAHSAPVYLAIGNHEDEEGWNLDDTQDPADSRPVMSINARKRNFLNPLPGGFFSGNTDTSITAIAENHMPEDYYAFEWGDALFVVLDPYFYTMTKPYPGTQGGEGDDEITGNRWDWTLGTEQREWFKQTLEQSSAKWKFVFSHQVCGGTNMYGRGGAATTQEFEWGAGPIAIGNQRPLWSDSTSIHNLMVENNVTIFFHGHDHVYAMEEVDSMIYQECPQPCDIDYDTGFDEYNNNDSTVMINNSGHIRVRVSEQYVQVDYVRAYLPAHGTNGTIAHTYYIGSAAGVEESEATGYSMDVFPNPASEETNIRFNLPEKQHVKISILNMMGYEVMRPADEVMDQGQHNLKVYTNTLSSGQYFIRIESGEFCAVRKLVVL
mgnify:CR=1 FL=1